MLRQIKYFVTVVDCNSFTEAAEQCFISQSAISQQISALEKDMGVALLKREARRFTLTPAGEYLYRHGKALLQQADAVRAETIRIGQNVRQTLRVGYLEEYEGTAMRETVYEFTAHHPDVVLNIVKSSHEGLFLGISQGTLDLVFSYQRRAFSEEYVNHHLRYVPCMVELSARNPLASLESVRTDQLTELPCILIAKREQQEIEREYYHTILGIGSNYTFAENLSEARMNVIGNQGFLPISEISAPSEAQTGIRRLPLLRSDSQPIHFNYCAFWKKERANGYIEDFVSIFQNKTHE